MRWRHDAPRRDIGHLSGAQVSHESLQAKLERTRSRACDSKSLVSRDARFWPNAGMRVNALAR